MTPSEFLDLIKAEGITCYPRGKHVILSGSNDYLIQRLASLLTANPEFEAKVIQLMLCVKPADFLHELDSLGLSYRVEHGRVILEGDYSKGITRCYRILAANPELEAQLILMCAAHDSDLLDAIEEHASIRWVEGYSDSLFQTVLSGIIDTGEKLEFNDSPDMKQVEFLRRMGFTEEKIMNPESCPSAWVKQKPRTNWEAELVTYTSLSLSLSTN